MESRFVIFFSTPLPLTVKVVREIIFLLSLDNEVSIYPPLFFLKQIFLIVILPVRQASRLLFVLVLASLFGYTLVSPPLSGPSYFLFSGSRPQSSLPIYRSSYLASLPVLWSQSRLQCFLLGVPWGYLALKCRDSLENLISFSITF